MYNIVADTADFIVISKNAGVHFHSQDGSAGVAAQLGTDTGYQLYPVHRLDTMTSGLLLFAKTLTAAQTFTQMFSDHQVQKYYLAIAHGKPKKKQGWIVGDMAKSRRSMYKLLRTTENPAMTQFFSHALGDGNRVYLLKPLTGKTHQLRVALASIGVPIWGDPLYNVTKVADRGYLHAFVLQFDYCGQSYHYCVQPQEGQQWHNPLLQQQLAQWQNPEQLDWPTKK